jgi:hypothetical protein
MAELCRVYGIVKLRTTSYKASTNGLVERFHRTLNSMLGKVVSEAQRDWDQYVGQVLAAYRATIHQSTGYTPNFLVYGRETRAPIDLVLAVDDEPPGVGTSPNQFVNEMAQRQRAAYSLARQNLGRAAERRKREYDLRVRHRQFKVGDWVFYYYPRRYKGRSPKWARTYTGPYLVVREIPPCNYVIQRSARSKSLVTHADKLKLCLGETPQSWLPTGTSPEKGESTPEREEADPSVGTKEVHPPPEEATPVVSEPDDARHLFPTGTEDRELPTGGALPLPDPPGRVLRNRDQRKPNQRYRDFV